MNQSQPDKGIPILVGGVFLGVLSALPVLNCACCLWVIGGGVLASYLYLRNYPSTLPPLTYGDGALLGALAGVVGAFVDTIISIPVKLLFTVDVEDYEQFLDLLNLPSETREIIEGFFAGGGLGVVSILIELLICLVIFTIFATVGGILGIALFQKKAPPPPAPVSPGASPGAGYQPPGPPTSSGTPPQAPPTSGQAPSGEPGSQGPSGV